MLNEYLDYITPDGLVYNFDSHDRFISGDPENMGMPEIDYITQQGPMQHGQTVIDYRLKPRVIQLLQRADLCDRYDYWSSRANIINYLRPNRQSINAFTTGKLRKRLPSGEVICMDCLISSGPSFGAKDSGQWDEWGYSETLRFIAFEPTWYSESETSIIWMSQVINELKFPATFEITFENLFLAGSTSITYTGTWLAFPDIDIVGPIANFYIINTTTGEELRLGYNVPAGVTAYIRLPYSAKRVITNTGLDITGTVENFGDLATFHIEPSPGAPGGINTFVIGGSGTQGGVTSITLRYKTRFIGR